MKKVIVSGHICIDITPSIAAQGDKALGEILMPGKLLQTGGAFISTGGAVANTGLAMKKFGADVKLIGKVGDDEFGDMILNILKKHGADSGMVKAKGENSSYSVVLAIPGIDRMFLHCPGANNTFSASDVSVDELEDASLFHFGYPPIMEKMYQNDGEQLISLMKKVQEAGCATSLDLAAVDANSEAGRADWEKILAGAMPYIDFFVPSIEELCFMIDKERFKDWEKRADAGDMTLVLDIERDIKPLADKCMKMGCKVLLLKCGIKGLYMQTASEDVIMKISPRLELDAKKWADINLFEASFKPSKVLSATGAGDTSIAAFLTAMLNGEDPKTCIALASATGACCVEGYDALSGLKPLDELKEKIKAGWEKNNAC